MAIVMQLGIILSVSFVGEVLGALLPLPIPASVYGLCLMLALLCTGVLKPAQIRQTADFLIRMMPVMFVPVAAGVMTSWNVLGPVLLPFALAITAGTALVMGVTGRVVQALEQRKGDKPQ